LADAELHHGEAVRVALQVHGSGHGHNRSPASRLAAGAIALHPPRGARMACEIEDRRRFDKRVFSAMRRPRICCARPPRVTVATIWIELAAAVEPGGFGAAGKEFDERRGPARRRPRLWA